jgi:YD repeat-containing protein
MTLATAPEGLRHAVVSDLGRRLGSTYGPSGAVLSGPGFAVTVATPSVGTTGDMRPLSTTFQRASGGGTYGSGGVTESYRSTGTGVEQTFQIESRPNGTNSFLIDVPVSGLSATTAGSVVDLRDPAGETRATYGGLRVTDATGATLPATMSATSSGDGIVIRVDDRDAEFPVMIDPTWSAVDELNDPVSAEDLFGYSVGVSGNNAVVGAVNQEVDGHAGEGAAYVFSLSGGSWSETAELTGLGGAAGDEFGYSAAISGSTIVVGAVSATVDGHVDRGVVDVFSLSDGSWTQTAALSPSDGYLFGTAVAVSGSTIVVGAVYESDYGQAYVFQLEDGAWTQTAELSSDEVSVREFFGISVAVSGSTVVVGAPNEEEYSTENPPGAVYVFGPDGTGWTQEAVLEGIDEVAYSGFGSSVAVSGSTIAASDGDNVTDEGVVLVFNGSGSTWTQTAELTSSDETGTDGFGGPIAISGSTIAVGADLKTVDGHENQGAAYIFQLEGGSWSQTTELTASDGAAGDSFGSLIGLSGSTVVITSATHEVDGESDEGAAYVFSSGPEGAITPLNTPGSLDGSVKHAVTCSCGGPVNMSTGTQWLSRTDLSVPGRGVPLGLSETYSTTQAGSEGLLGYGWSWSYGISLTDGDGSALSGSPSVVDLDEENGAVQEFVLSGSSWVPADPQVDATLVHNGDGTWTVVREGTESLTFNSSGQLTSEADLNGETTSISYPSSTSIVVTDPAGRTLTATLSSGSHPLITSVSASGSPSRTVSFGYDSSGDLTSITGVNGGETSYGYDSDHRLVEERSPRFYSSGSLPTAPSSCTGTAPADVESSVYDSDGRVICQWDPDGRETTFAWVDDGLGDGLVSEATMTDPKGNVTDFEFNAGELVSKTVGWGTDSAATWSYGYDPVSLGMTWSQDPDGNVTTATFDGDGNMLSQTDPDGNTTTWTYNSYNEVTSETPPAT